MELDLTSMADEIAARIWDARDSQHMQGPYAELSIDTQSKLKEAILPVMFHAIPVVKREVESKFEKDVATLDYLAEVIRGLNLKDRDELTYLGSHAVTVVSASGRDVSSV